MGAGCAVLECAIDRGVGHCLRDCDEFPCGFYRDRDYPFSQGFLDMQERRRSEAGEGQQVAWPAAAAEYWEELAARPLSRVCTCGLATPTEDDLLTVQCLNETWQVDLSAQTISKVQGAFGGEWDRQIPYLLLIYLARVKVAGTTGEMTSPVELYHGVDPFNGSIAFETGDLLSAFGRNPKKIFEVAESLGGRKTRKADASAIFYVFPRLPVELLLWGADEEFPAKLTVLFDRSMPLFFPVDGAAKVVNLLLQRIIFTGAS